MHGEDVGLQTAHLGDKEVADLVQPVVQVVEPNLRGTGGCDRRARGVNCSHILSSQLPVCMRESPTAPPAHLPDDLELRTRGHQLRVLSRNEEARSLPE